MMDKKLEEKRKYFKDSVYLKYENLKFTEPQKNEFEDIKINNKMKLNSLQKVAAFIIVSTVSITAYAGISKNTNMQKMGFLKLSQNYENNLVEINQSIENEYCNITLESMAGDKAYIIASSKQIKRNNDNPPSYRAKNVYTKHLDDDERFICTAEYPDSENPKPLVLKITGQGVSVKSVTTSAVKKSNSYTPKSYGIWS